MARKQTFLAAGWSESWRESYVKLSAEHQAACDEAMVALIKQTLTSGLRVKPIQPEKYYLEARIDSGNRIIFRIDEGKIYFVDVVKHDEIWRYGKRPKSGK
jgi:mRNA-degrading endonuclease RelE of RelBE toxin-antitoxin system